MDVSFKFDLLQLFFKILFKQSDMGNNRDKTRFIKSYSGPASVLAKLKGSIEYLGWGFSVKGVNRIVIVLQAP